MMNSPRRPKIHAPNVDCPRCHAYNVTVTTSRVDRVTGRKIASDATYSLFYGAMVWLVLVVVVDGLFPLLFGLDNFVTLALPGWILFLISLVTAFVLSQRAEVQAAKGILVSKYLCELCGYSWEKQDAHA